MNVAFVIFVFVLNQCYQLAVRANDVVVRGNLAFPRTLYQSSDDVLILDGSNFDATVLHSSDTAHYVQFYLSWCGHCRKFSATFIKFAHDVKSWKDVAKVAVVNCAVEENEGICKNNQVHGVPTIKYFPRNAASYNDSWFVDFGEETEIETRNALVDAILTDYSMKNSQTMPNFTYLSNSSLSHAWDDESSGREYLAIVLESNNDSYSGAEFLLDTVSLKWLKSRRAKYPNDFQTAGLQVAELPYIAVFKRNQAEPIYQSKFSRTVLNDVVKLAPSDGLTLSLWLTTASSITATSVATASQEILRSRYFASETDMLLAVWYALDNEVPFDREIIDAARFTNLKNFLHILKMYFPQTSEVRQTLEMLNISHSQQTYARSENARNIFSDLYDFLNNKTDDAVLVSEYQNLFQSLESKYHNPFPKNSDWQHCKGSEVKYRGYTCGLWTMFHTLTVNAFLEDGFKPNFDPFAVLRGIKGYVESFFGCSTCAAHFHEMVTKEFPMSEWVNYASDSVVYLWRAHNHVNKRLAGDITEDPTMPKRQFPAPFLCEQCRDGEQGGWINRAVLKYLLSYYTNIVPAEDEHSSNNNNNTIGNNKVRFRNGLFRDSPNK